METLGTFQPTVRHLMTSDPLVILATATLAEVAEFLDEFRIGGVPVVDDDGRLLGLVSETDLTRLRGSGLPRAMWHGVVARDVMSHPVITIQPSDSLAEAARLMTEHHVHRLVVVGPHGEPVGVISESDLVREIADSCDID